MAGLFTSGEQDMLGNIVQQRQQANQALGSGYGKYGGIVQAGAALTDVGADAMTGGKIGSADPRMQQLQGAKAIFTKVAQEMGEVNSAAFYEKLSQELAAKYPEQAQKAAEEAVKAKKQGYELGALEDKEKAKAAVASVLAKNPNATSQELYAAAAPFSSDPEAIIKVVAAKEDKVAASEAKAAEKAQAASDKLEQLKLQGQQRLDVAREQAQSRIDAATIAGASREQIAQMQIESRKEIAQMQAEARQETSRMMGQIRLDIARENNVTKREIEASKRNTGVLAPSLQKEEGADLELIDTYEAMSAVLDTPVKSLTPDEKTGVVALSLDPLSRANYAARNYAGKSSPESRAYADLQASVAQAVNIKTDAAKGVQTDKDVLRFANALIEASARNDVKGTREALVKFQDAAKTAAAKTKVRVNSRRQAQNVGVYFTDVATPEGTSPSGTTKTTTPPIYATNGKQRIVSTDGGKTWKEVE